MTNLNQKYGKWYRKLDQNSRHFAFAKFWRRNEAYLWACIKNALYWKGARLPESTHSGVPE